MSHIEHLTLPSGAVRWSLKGDSGEHIWGGTERSARAAKKAAGHVQRMWNKTGRIAW